MEYSTCLKTPRISLFLARQGMTEPLMVVVKMQHLGFRGSGLNYWLSSCCQLLSRLYAVSIILEEMHNIVEVSPQFETTKPNKHSKPT